MKAIQSMTGSAQGRIALLAILSIAVHLGFVFSGRGTSSRLNDWIVHSPLWFCLALGGTWLISGLVQKLLRKEFGADLLAGIAIVTAVILGEYLAATLVVLMLSGGEALEQFAVSRASSALRALAARLPAIAHRRTESGPVDVPLNEIRIGDELVVLPHEVAPVDGVVLEGHGAMDEAYLTGEPYQISKAPGAPVISGAINGEHVLIMKATKLPADSRYAKIMEVMRQAEANRPRIRRLGEALGAFYTPLAVGLGVLAWWLSGDVLRFLAVLVVATPCPLIIAIPIAIIGAISVAAKRGIIIRDPSVLERVAQCTTMILDKTGTLTYGKPSVTEVVPIASVTRERVLALAATLEQYSRHPLAKAVLDAADSAGLVRAEAEQVGEPPGQGLTGVVAGSKVAVTSRKLAGEIAMTKSGLPARTAGLECIVMLDGAVIGLIRFRDGPRPESRPFIEHLGQKHRISKIMIVSGDRESEVSYLASQVGITDVRGGHSPEQKVEVIREEERTGKVVFIGDGINDAPGLRTASVGIAFGPNSDVTSEAAGAVIMEPKLGRVDEFLHIGAHMRQVAITSAVGGMALSIIGMGFAASGSLSPVAGALVQECIDIAAIVYALTAARAPRVLSDY